MKTNKMKCWIARSLAVLVFLLVCGGYFYFFGGTRTTVLMYHHIVSEEELQAKWIGNNAVISDVQFEEEMKYLHDEGYTTLLPSEVARMYEVGEALPEQCVVVTFDDGYESNYLLALPILQKYNVKAAVAVVAEYVQRTTDTGEQFDVDFNYLNFEQMRLMNASGMIEFGCHTYNGHGLVRADETGKEGAFMVTRRYLSDKKRMETKEEYITRIEVDVQHGKQLLEEKLGVAVTYFAYPYGRHNSHARAAVERAGYQIAVTTKTGRIGAGSDLLALKRQNVEQNIDLKHFSQLVA